MAKVETAHIEGLAALDRALRELPGRIANRGLRASVYAGAKVVRDEARRRAPKAAASSGPNQPPPGTLKRSIIMKHIRALSGGGRQTFFVLVRHGKKYRKQGKRGNLSQDAWYWRFLEFGTRKMRARPFLRPALEARRREAVEAMKVRLAERIEIEAKALHRPVAMQDFFDAIKHLAGGEVYAVLAPQAAQYPVIVYTPIDQVQIIALDGPNSLRRLRVQVDSYARTLEAAQALQDQVLQAIVANIDTVADVRMELTDFDEEARVYRVSVDYTFYR